jgi:hypothetical protein
MDICFCCCTAVDVLFPAGLELFTDLVLADYIAATGSAGEVVVHADPNAKLPTPAILRPRMLICWES